MNRIVILAFAFLLTLPLAAPAQTRPRTASKRGTQPAKTSRTQKAGAQQAATQARTEGATKVADQIKILTKFLYLLGGAAKGIEQLDEEARRNQASPTALQQNDRNKASFKSSLENVRVGLDQLEIYFRATPELQNYYLKLAGSASGAAACAPRVAGTTHRLTVGGG